MNVRDVHMITTEILKYEIPVLYKTLKLFLLSQAIRNFLHEICW
jgi:hypothetical protein